jgi:hypothetical protein
MSDTNNIGQSEPDEGEAGGNPEWSLRGLQYLMLLTMLVGIGIASFAGGELGSIALAVGGGVIAAISGAFYVYLTIRG